MEFCSHFKQKCHEEFQIVVKIGLLNPIQHKYDELKEKKKILKNKNNSIT